VRGFCALVDDRSELEEARRAVRDAAAQASLAEDRERRALASDLHDDVGQLVSLLAIKLRELRAQVGRSSSGGRLGELEDLTRQIRKRISSLSFELSPPLLYDVGFAAAAEWLAESLQGRYGLRTSFERRGDLPPLDESTSVTLFRALRELLINVARHAGTNRARVVLAGGTGEVSVTVQDQGCGFEPHAGGGGFGLRSLRERIELLGGRISFDSAPRRGTSVSIHVPAPEPRKPVG
ncbi:MAG TPA: sensor histidine kinase, partial [Myxococcota bacterium]|nr:sensor histidine kinase [Myxococcota bacterium]